MKINNYVSLEGLKQDGLSKEDLKWFIPLFLIIILGSAAIFKI